MIGEKHISPAQKWMTDENPISSAIIPLILRKQMKIKALIIK
jgi:hypothetical protein